MSQRIDPLSQPRLAFGAFVLDRERGALLGPDGELRLRPKAYAVLAHLVQRPGQLVSKDELLQAVWGRAIVTEDSLTQCVVEIRRALGEGGRDMIRTVPRRGYRLAAEVTLVDASAAVASAAAAPVRVEEEPDPHSAGDLARVSPARPDAVTSKVGRSGRSGFESIAAGLMMLVLFAFIGWSFMDRPAREPVEVVNFSTGEIAARGPSLAVLPFADMSPAGDHAYFGDGMAEEILNLLAEARGMRVIARTSSFSLRDTGLDIPAMGRRLGVTHILEGSVRPAGNRVRITAQLVDASDGAHLWSETYDRDLGDVLTVQDEIAVNVASLLHASLSEREATRGDGGRRIALSAYEHKLRGQHLFSRRSAGDLEAAVARFEAAVALEPGYAEAWVGLAGARWVLMLEDGVMEGDEVSAFHEAALRGVQLGPGLPEAHLRAMTAYRVAGDPAAAERHFRIARELDPENPLLLGMTAGQALADGHLDEAIDYHLRALRSDPLSLTLRNNLAFFLLGAGRIDEARQQLDFMNDIGPHNEVSTMTLELSLLLQEGRYAEAGAIARDGPATEEWIARVAMSLHALGRQDEALEAAAALVASESYQAAFGLAEFHAWRGDVDAALESLARARERLALAPRLPSTPTWLQLVTLSPFLEPLRVDPRFEALARMPQ